MSQKRDVKLIASLFGVAILWGTTYLGIRIAVHTIPAWYVAGLRQTTASVILLVMLFNRQQLKWIGWKNFRRQILLATLMLVIANGMTTVAEESIPSGLTSLLTALSPIVVFLGSVAVGLQKPSLKGFIGVVVGFSGVAFIFREGIGDLLDPHYKTGIIYLAIAVAGWAGGTIYAKKNAHKSENMLLDLFYQFAFSAVAQLVIAVVVQPSPKVAQWTWQSMVAIAYLGVFGSIVGYFCYNYALKRVSPTEVSMLSYFNTIIAIFLGWLILSEPVTFDLLIATVLIILGVFITNYRK